MKLTMTFLFACLTLSAEDLRITVYNRAHLSPEVAAEVAGLLHSIFRQSGIDIQLQAGDPEADEGKLVYLNSRPRNAQLLLMACGRARRDIALEILDSAPDGVSQRTLGVSSPLAPAGLNARVFDRRVQDAAFRENRAHAVVLAHAIAHEIGHVLLRSADHESWGLMSSRWTDQEYSRMAAGGLGFTKAQSRKLLGTLQGAGCGNR